MAGAMTAASEEPPISRVRLSGLAALRIIQHCKGFYPSTVTGQLLGMDAGEVLEVTDAFPFPSADAQDDDDGGDYHISMMRCLKENNVDSYTAGWYQSAGDNGWQTQELVKLFCEVVPAVRRCVVIVYDHPLLALGHLPLRAVTVAENVLELLKKGASALTFERLLEARVAWSDIFTEIPMEVVNNPLVHALTAELRAQGSLQDVSPSALDLSVSPFLCRNLGHSSELCDDMVAEQTKVTKYHKTLQWQQAQVEAARAKRRQENAERRARGEDPLPETDVLPGVKPVEPPSMLDNYLISAQMVTYAEQVHAFAKQSLAKLHIAAEM